MPSKSVKDEQLKELISKIKEDAMQVVLRDAYAIPEDVYILTRRIFIKASEALKLCESQDS